MAGGNTMKRKTIVGIDPGQKGAIAVFNPDGLDIWDLKPLITETGSFNSLDAVKLSELIQSAIYRDPSEVAVFCEESLIVHGNGIKTARPIFDSRGVMRSVFALHGITAQFVSPHAWKKHFGLAKAEKSASVEKATHGG